MDRAGVVHSFKSVLVLWANGDKKREAMDTVTLLHSRTCALLLLLLLLLLLNYSVQSGPVQRQHNNNNNNCIAARYSTCSHAVTNDRHQNERSKSVRGQTTWETFSSARHRRLVRSFVCCGIILIATAAAVAAAGHNDRRRRRRRRRSCE